MRVRTYTNAKEVTRVQVVLDMDEAKSMIKGDDSISETLRDKLAGLKEFTAAKATKASGSKGKSKKK